MKKNNAETSTSVQVCDNCFVFSKTLNKKETHEALTLMLLNQKLTFFRNLENSKNTL